MTEEGMDTAPGIAEEEMREILAGIVWISRCELLDERSTFTLSEALAAMRAVASRTRPQLSVTDEDVERVAKAIWESVAPYRKWDARMSFYRATPEAKEVALARGSHPDNFNHNGDVEEAFQAARAAIAAMPRTRPSTPAPAPLKEQE